MVEVGADERLAFFEEAFQFKLAEARYFAGEIGVLKRSLERPFLGKEYTDSTHKRIVRDAQRVCERAAYYYDALMSSSFSALDTFAHIYSVVKPGARKKDGSAFKQNDIYFTVWFKQFKPKLRRIKQKTKSGKKAEAVQRFIQAEKFFRILRENRNFYAHQKHVLQDLDAPCGFVSVLRGKISSVSLPPLVTERREPILLDRDAEKIAENLTELEASARELRSQLQVEFV
jgi:hypothetical protein